MLLFCQLVGSGWPDALKVVDRLNAGLSKPACARWSQVRQVVDRLTKVGLGMREANIRKLCFQLFQVPAGCRVDNSCPIPSGTLDLPHSMTEIL
jgi:hypothetical protein